MILNNTINIQKLRLSANKREVDLDTIANQFILSISFNCFTKDGECYGNIVEIDEIFLLGFE